MPDKKICVVGAGYWGKNLVRVFNNDLGVLGAVCDKDEKNLSAISQKYPGVNFYKSMEDAFSDMGENISAVAVATPAITHFEVVRRALAEGKDVFVEKPLAMKVEEGEALAELADKNGRILMIGHILNYHPAVTKLEEILKDGSLGKIYYIYSNRLNIGKLRSEENILWSFAPHDISVIIRLCGGEKPSLVRAMGGDYLQKGIHDTTISFLEFPSGIKGHIFVSWLNPFKEQKLVVVGSKGMAVFDDTQPWEEKLVVYPHGVSWVEGRIPVAQIAQKTRVEISPKTEPLRLECEHFLGCVETRKKPLTDAGEGLKVLEVLGRAQESLFSQSTFSSYGDKSSHGKISSQKTDNYYVDATAIIDEGAKIGSGTKIWAFSHILKNTTVGQNCNIGQNVVIGPDVIVGNGCKIQNNVSIYKGVTLEDRVFCGPSMVFTNIINPRAEIPRMKELKTTIVREGASLGANSTIVCGNNIGRYAFVGAGAVVTRDVPDFALVYGNPATIKGWVCRCGVKLNFAKNKNATCSACGRRYKKLSAKEVKEI